MDFTHTRWRADPTAAFGAELDGELVGKLPMSFEIAPHLIQVFVP